jgi:hypothetical protein
MPVGSYLSPLQCLDIIETWRFGGRFTKASATKARFALKE